MKKKIVFTDETDNSMTIYIDFDQPAVYIETKSGENEQEVYCVFTEVQDLDELIGELITLKDQMIANAKVD